MIMYISESTRPDKERKAKAEGYCTLHFGERGASDYTLHHRMPVDKHTSPDTAAGKTGAGRVS